MITYERLVGFFDYTRQLKSEGQANYDIDQLCRWSYFFIDSNRDKLVQAGRHVETLGYEVVGFLDPSPEDKEQTIYLRFDRIEQHTPDSLFTRNAELYKVAADFDLEGYDGMDVGAIDGP